MNAWAPYRANDTKESKQRLAKDITILSLGRTDIFETSTILDEFVLSYISEILSSHDIPYIGYIDNFTQFD